MKIRLLRVILFAASFGWGISMYGLFSPWKSAVQELQNMGLQTVPSDPMLDYWLRMAAGAFTAIGVIFFFIALNPHRYQPIIRLAGILLIAGACLLLYHGIRLNIGPLPFILDVTFCLSTGFGMFFLSDAAKEQV